MRNFRLTFIACVSLAFLQPSLAKPEKTKCNPNGTENEIIGCIHNENVDLWERLSSNYSKYLDSIIDKCSKDFSGGGSGGFSDRVMCVKKAFEGEAKRIDLKK